MAKAHPIELRNPSGHLFAINGAGVSYMEIGIWANQETYYHRQKTLGGHLRLQTESMILF